MGWGGNPQKIQIVGIDCLEYRYPIVKIFSCDPPNLMRWVYLLIYEKTFYVLAKKSPTLAHLLFLFFTVPGWDYFWLIHKKNSKDL